ncbi:uncharacterized protein EI90DRAFT_277674 [Cantharellus anzutake]|uniref:uncharacterized protein n=1 Tax=Cantharellus anzutake TaxID=1750568 RepID=UPI0019044C97|nr:uncharacterized protein EI90DRAFT_277674 [Cantharellus anzutake]KAF8335929.1 hypothetical protein EI90DRAFT_277674 [Cantharellus anzutake]
MSVSVQVWSRLSNFSEFFVLGRVHRDLLEMDSEMRSVRDAEIVSASDYVADEHDQYACYRGVWSVLYFTSSQIRGSPGVLWPDGRMVPYRSNNYVDTQFSYERCLLVSPMAMRRGTVRYEERTLFGLIQREFLGHTASTRILQSHFRSTIRGTCEKDDAEILLGFHCSAITRAPSVIPMNAGNSAYQCLPVRHV